MCCFNKRCIVKKKKKTLQTTDHVRPKRANYLPLLHLLLFAVSVDSYPCHVISGSISGVIADSFVVLVKLKNPFNTDTFHLVQFEGEETTSLIRLLT